MTRISDPPPALVETVSRYECPKCGTGCDCGVPYGAKTVRAAEYAQQNPKASVRQIAKATGASVGTPYKAKVGVQSEHLTATPKQAEPAPKPSKPAVAKPAQHAAHDPLDALAEAAELKNRIVHVLMPLMTDDGRDQFRVVLLADVAKAAEVSA
jgi:hypothetical protein